MGEMADFALESTYGLSHWDSQSPDRYYEYDSTHPPVRLPIEMARACEWFTKEQRYISLRDIDLRYATNIAAFIDRSPNAELYKRQRQFLKKHWKV